MERPDYRTALRVTSLLDALTGFDPHIAGTPPLGLDLPGSDIDILCHAPDPAAFAAHVWNRLSDHTEFALRQWADTSGPVIATFHAHGWWFEIFGSAEPVGTQAGWRHFMVERRLLAAGGNALRNRVMMLRHQGLKTEPAFAAALGLGGNPYDAILQLENRSGADLRRLVSSTLIEVK